MYDLAEMRGAIDEFWAVLSSNLRRNEVENVPERLSHNRNLAEFWSDPDLLISQCCGYDVVNRYKGQLRPVATPNFTAHGCQGNNYCSVIVVAEDCRFHDARQMSGCVAVVNGFESHSGMNTLRHLIAKDHIDGRFFSEVFASGSHAASLDMIRLEKADVAAIDNVTLSLLRKHKSGAMEGLKTLGLTYPAPAPPYVVKASLGEDQVKKVQLALLQTFADSTLAGCRADLLLNGLTLTGQEDYWVMDAFKDYASKHGFPTLQ